MGTGGQSGGGGGGGAAVDATIDQGTFTIPVDELYATTTIAPRAKPIVEAAWQAMDDDDRRFVINALKGGDIGYMEGRTRPDGEARFQGKRRTPIARGGVAQSEVEWESTGKIRIHKRTMSGDGGVRAAGVLIHEARHVDVSGGKAAGPNRKWSQQERAATGRQLDFHEKGAIRGLARGDRESAANHLFMAAKASQYRGNVISDRGNDPMLARFRDVGFAGSRTTGKFMWDESARPMMSIQKRINYSRDERMQARLEGVEVR